MEVASPLAFPPVQTGTKRGLASCSPSRMDTSVAGGNHTSIHHDAAMAMGDENSHLRSAKRRRFHNNDNNASIESLSEKFSSHAPFFSASLNPAKAIFSNSSSAVQHHHASSLKRMRAAGGSSSPVQNELKRVVEEQNAVIESLKKDKSSLESSVETLKSEHERTQKENQLLRRAVNIQQDRQNHAEKEIKAAQEYRADAEERIRKLEQVVLALRYHLQAQQPSQLGNDFMGQRPPDVF